MVQTAANKGVLLALVAMAQTFVVLTAGIDLSVGMMFVLCQLPRLRTSSPARSADGDRLGIVGVLARGRAVRRGQRR